MSICSTCHQSILSNAQFCHNCGSSQSDSDCSNCGYLNPSGWSRCENCGLAPGMTSENTAEFQGTFHIDFREIPAIQPQIEKHFNEFLTHKTKEEFGTDAMCDYLTIFKKSDYPDDVKMMSAKLAEQAYTFHCAQNLSVQSNIDALLVQTFSSLVNEFFLSYCYNTEPIPTQEEKPATSNAGTTSSTGISSSNSATQTPPRVIDAADLPLPTKDREVELPADQGQPTNQHPVIRNVGAYFDAENSPFKVYDELNKMPARILDEVKKNFLFNAPEENILLVYDDTVFGSGSTGFALTQYAVYWKTHFQNAHRTYYQEIMNLEMKGSKLEINNVVFDIDAAVNYKVYEWLRSKAFEGMQ